MSDIKNPPAAINPTRLLRHLSLIMMLSMIGFMGFNAVIGIVARELGLAEWHVGVFVTLAGLAWMLASGFWGKLSDRKGRRIVLRIGLGGNAIGFLLLAVFITWALPHPPSIALTFGCLLVLRAGITVFYAAIQPAAQSLVADITTPAERARGIALLSMGSAFGMVFGPAMMSALAIHELSLPFWGALIAVAAAYLVGTRLPQMPPRMVSHDKPPLQFWDRRLFVPMVAATFAMLSVISAQIITGFFAQDRFGFSSPAAASQAGRALTAVGVALIAAGYAVRRTGASPRRLMLTGAPIASLGFSSIVFITTPEQMLLSYFVTGFGMGLVFPAFAALASLSVAESEQGAALGAVAFAQGFGMTCAPLISTLLYRLAGPAAPFLLNAAMMALLAIIALIMVPRGPTGTAVHAAKR